jgi:predicted DNA-binding ribbon-helix-helix protein
MWIARPTIATTDDRSITKLIRWVWEGTVKSTVVKRSIVLAGHKTSVSLEDAFWEGLKDIASTRHKTLSELIDGIDVDRTHANLSSAIRLFVLNHYQGQAAWAVCRWPPDKEEAPAWEDRGTEA